MLTGTLLITPFAFRYDMTFAVLGLAFLTRHLHAHGWQPGQKALVAILWLTPAAMPFLADATRIQFGTLVLWGQVIWIWQAHRQTIP